MSNQIICERCGKDLTKAVSLLGNEIITHHKQSHDYHDLRQALVILGRFINNGAIMKPGEEHITELALRTFEEEKDIAFHRIKNSCVSFAEARRLAHGLVLLSEEQREKKIKEKLGES